MNDRHSDVSKLLGRAWNNGWTPNSPEEYAAGVRVAIREATRRRLAELFARCAPFWGSA